MRCSGPVGPMTEARTPSSTITTLVMVEPMSTPAKYTELAIPRLAYHLQEGLDAGAELAHGEQAVVVLQVQDGYPGLLQELPRIGDIRLVGVTEADDIENDSLHLPVPDKILEVAKALAQVLLPGAGARPIGPGAVNPLQVA